MHNIINFFAGYIQPQLIQARFDHTDDDGFLDRHWFSTTNRKKVYFKDIGKKADKDQSLTRLFLAVFKAHHGENNEVSIYPQNCSMNHTHY